MGHVNALTKFRDGADFRHDTWIGHGSHFRATVFQELDGYFRNGVVKRGLQASLETGCTHHVVEPAGSRNPPERTEPEAIMQKAVCFVNERVGPIPQLTGFTHSAANFGEAQGVEPGDEDTLQMAGLDMDHDRTIAGSG